MSSLFSLNLLAQAPMGMGGNFDVIMNQAMDAQKDPKTDDAKMQAFQAQMIKQLFLDHIFGKDPLSNLTDDEEESAFAGQNFDKELQNRMLMDHMANMLAKEDILGLNKQLEKYVHKEK